MRCVWLGTRSSHRRYNYLKGKKVEVCSFCIRRQQSSKLRTKRNEWQGVGVTDTDTGSLEAGDQGAEKGQRGKSQNRSVLVVGRVEEWEENACVQAGRGQAIWYTISQTRWKRKTVKSMHGCGGGARGMRESERTCTSC